MWLLLAVGSALSAVGFSVVGDLVFQPRYEGDARARQANLLMTVLAVSATMLCAVFLFFWLAELFFAPLQGLEGHGGGGGFD
jgi:hypothetical protein